MMRISVTVTLTDEEARDLGDYLVLCYPPHKDGRQHSLNWLRKEMLKIEFNAAMSTRLEILRGKADNHKRREAGHNERQTTRVPGGKLL
jgi:alkanesulfonate monooxygenase SsuD/methylene tetrahydromethanopterin reductase-like flavin-dependent oxidoreductase (luciferase family)